MEQCRIAIRVQPNAPHNQIVRREHNVLRVRVAAPPVEGKANHELLSFLAKRLGLKRHQLLIVSGGASRDKVIEISGLSLAEVRERLLPTAEG